MGWQSRAGNDCNVRIQLSANVSHAWRQQRKIRHCRQMPFPPNFQWSAAATTFFMIIVIVFTWRSVFSRLVSLLWTHFSFFCLRRCHSDSPSIRLPLNICFNLTIQPAQTLSTAPSGIQNILCGLLTPTWTSCLCSSLQEAIVAPFHSSFLSNLHHHILQFYWKN